MLMSSGNITIRIIARALSIMSVITTPPNSIMGALTHRLCSCATADCTL